MRIASSHFIRYKDFQEDEMPAYVIVNTRITDVSKRKQYDEYIAKIMPIIESHGGKYIIKSERMTALSDS